MPRLVLRMSDGLRAWLEDVMRSDFEIAIDRDITDAELADHIVGILDAHRYVEDLDPGVPTAIGRDAYRPYARATPSDAEPFAVEVSEALLAWLAEEAPDGDAGRHAEAILAALRGGAPH